MLPLISCDERLSLDDINKYEGYHGWIKKIKLYKLVKAEKLLKPSSIENLGLSDIEFTLYLVLLMFKSHKNIDFCKYGLDLYRNWIPEDCNGVIRSPRSLRRYMYYKIDNDYKWFTKTNRFFGPSSYFISDEECFRYIKEVVSGVIIKKDGYPINTDGLCLHVQIYKKFIGNSKVVDHINGIRHDARLVNLRGATIKENMENVVRKRDLYNDFFIGVFREGPAWKAKFSNKLFDTAIEAAKEYDKNLKDKPFSRTNKSLNYY